VRIVTIGGGPAGLYFGILMKKRFPDVEITIHERNRPDDTFGFGVVFSDETLGFLGDADRESYDAIRSRFRSWSEIETWYRGSGRSRPGTGSAPSRAPSCSGCSSSGLSSSAATSASAPRSPASTRCSTPTW